MRKLNYDNSLQNKFPEIAAEWHPTKNGDLTPSDVFSQSNKKYWFLCRNGHEWDVVLHCRTRKNAPCPYCTNARINENNSLFATFPEIAAEWHPAKNENITPHNVLPQSGKKYWFRCKKGHEWQARLQDRTKNKQKCPCCRNKKVCQENCLKIKFPEIAAEWHPTKNGEMTPNNVIAGSNKKYWFICKKGHEWQAVLNLRTYSSRKSGCPICSESKGEKIVKFILDELNIPYERQYKFNTCKRKRMLRFDFVIKVGNKTAAIEYQGQQHYIPSVWCGGKEKYLYTQQNDIIKRRWCKNNNVPLLEIPYFEIKKSEKLVKEFIATLA